MTLKRFGKIQFLAPTLLLAQLMTGCELPAGGGSSTSQFSKGITPSTVVSPLPGGSASVSPITAGTTSCVFNGQSVANGASVNSFLTASVPFGSACSSQSRTCSNGILSGTYSFTACSPAAAITCVFNGQTLANGATVQAYQASTVPFGSTCASQTRSCSNGVLSGSYTASTCAPGAAASCTFNGQSYSSGQSVTAYTSQSVPNGSSCSSVQTSLTCNNGNFPAGTFYPTCSVAAAPLVPQQVVFTAEPQNASAGAAIPSFAVSGIDQNNNPIALSAGSSCSVTVVTNTNSGLIGGSYSNIAVANGQAAFNQVMFQKAGTYSLQATCSGVATASAPSFQFTVSAATASSLAVITPPPTTLVSGGSFSAVVALTDAYSNPISSGTVVASSSSGSTLGGTTSVAVANGSATFSNLTLTSAAGGSFQVTFTSNGLTALTAQIEVSPVSSTLLQSLPNVNSVNSIRTDGTTLYISTDQGIAASTDGTHFTITVPTSVAPVPFTFFVENGIYCLVSSDRSSISVVSGTNVVTTVLTNIYDVIVVNGRILLATGGGIYSSTDNGATFTNVMSVVIPNYGGVFFSQFAVSSTAIFALGNYGIYVSTDGGNTFNLSGIPKTNYSRIAVVNDILFAQYPLYGPNGGFVSTILYHSTDNGNSFTESTFSQGNEALWAMATVNGKIFLQNLALAYAPLWTTNDGGNTFTPVNAVGAGNALATNRGSFIAFKNVIYTNIPYVNSAIPSLFCRSSDSGNTFGCNF